MKKIIAIILMAIGVLGFFYTTMQKDDMKVFGQRISGTSNQQYSVPLKANQVYEIKFWGVDEEMTGVFEQPHFEAHLKIFDGQQNLLFDHELISIHMIETGGKRVTHDGISYSHTPKTDELITIETEIKRGDYLDLDVYENMDSEADALPGFSIIIAIVGLVLYFRSRNKKTA